MSQALPMTTARRHDIYEASGRWTLRQFRQVNRMAFREHMRGVGSLPLSGASDVPTRRPLVFTSKPPERGSIRTHIAAYCAPCDQHRRRPRLHRYAVDNVHGSVTA